MSNNAAEDRFAQDFIGLMFSRKGNPYNAVALAGMNDPGTDYGRQGVPYRVIQLAQDPAVGGTPPTIINWILT